MRVIYDTKTDSLTIILRDIKIAESDEIDEGIIFDYDAQGQIVALEILDASRRVAQPTQMNYELVGIVALANQSSPVEQSPVTL
ncbi:DUF2283 domain-containing protein [Anaerolineales bacterium HSG24]|nr:DUF2283 domain-containing protein [Anaerolineales bacterium HSG24]